MLWFDDHFDLQDAGYLGYGDLGGGHFGECWIRDEEWFEILFR